MQNIAKQIIAQFVILRPALQHGRDESGIPVGSRQIPAHDGQHVVGIVLIRICENLGPLSENHFTGARPVRRAGDDWCGAITAICPPSQFFEAFLNTKSVGMRTCSSKSAGSDSGVFMDRTSGATASRTKLKKSRSVPHERHCQPIPSNDGMATTSRVPRSYTACPLTSGSIMPYSPSLRRKRMARRPLFFALWNTTKGRSLISRSMMASSGKSGFMRKCS